MKKSNFIAVLLALSFFILSSTSVNAQAEGLTIYGVVYNGTPSGQVPAELSVSLYVFTDGSQSGEYETKVDDSGVFLFDGLTLSEGDQVVAVTQYLDVTYMSSSFTYTEGQELPDLSLAIYETTEDPSDVYFAQISILLNEVDGQLRLGEYYLLGNRGDYTWIGAYDETLGVNTTGFYTLPEEAEGLWFSGAGLGDRFLSSENGFADTVPVVPGETSAEVFFSYDMPFSGKLQLERQMDRPVEFIEFLVSELGGIEVQGSGISFEGVVALESGNALSYIANPLDAGETLSFQVITKAEAGSPGPGWEIGLGITALVLSGLVVYWLWRKPLSRTLPLQAEPILNEIAELDIDYEKGEITKGQYQNKRKSLIGKIDNLIKK